MSQLGGVKKLLIEITEEQMEGGEGMGQREVAWDRTGASNTLT